ncbi:helix-turn-helix domain-containing protein [Changchengzhania lutea]|uniref:helix-turn-helix domain-containing protein n=1 Tax=Changchengzhania lutea TaxID=2049305 RepID=UPI00115DB716|nr:helix-turn-helix domain-containing protein [Changchengzhania lutea]
MNVLSFDWSSLLLFSGIINAFISVVILVFNKNNYKIRPLIWIILILASVSLILFERIIRFSDLEASYPEFLFISSPLFFFSLPLIYVFQKRLNKRLNHEYLHFIIPFLLFILLLPTITMSNSDKLDMYYTTGIHDPIWIILLYLIFAIFYSIKTLIENKRHKHYLLNEYASNAIELQLFSNKLVLLSSLLFIIIPIALSIQYFNFETEIFDKILFILFSLIPHFILIAILTLRTVDYSNTSQAGDKNDVDIKVQGLEVFKSDLTTFMVENKPFSSQELNLQTLANSIGWSRSKLSMIINKGFGKNFYDLINEYRLELVLERLHNGDHDDFSLDYIVSECGFKNYISFYRYFKQMKKTSPKEYIKHLKKS